MWWGMGSVSVLYLAVNICFVGPPVKDDRILVSGINICILDDHRPSRCAVEKQRLPRVLQHNLQLRYPS
jgi:hypothetical protein